MRRSFPEPDRRPSTGRWAVALTMMAVSLTVVASGWLIMHASRWDTLGGVVCGVGVCLTVGAVCGYGDDGEDTCVIDVVQEWLSSRSSNP